MVLIHFLASGLGRIVRIAAGIVLIALGLLTVSGTTGLVLAAIGLVPLVAGVFDFCLFAPLFGASLSGEAIRSHP